MGKIINALNERIENEKQLQNSKKSYIYFLMPKNEVIDLFGEDFSENSVFYSDYDSSYEILHFEENNRIYCIHYEEINEDLYRFLCFHPYGSQEAVYYYEPNELHLKEMLEEIHDAEKKIRVYSRVLNHPKHRLKGLFL